MVSMASLHFFRWTEQLKDSGHEVYWFDILDNGKQSKRISWVKQIVGWKLRWDFPARYWVKTKLPAVYMIVQKLNERNTTIEFEKVLIKIQPDVVHSFVLYISCVPIYNVMQRNKHTKWIYSAWGNDLYFYQNISKYKKEIDTVLPHIDYMFADCKRDLSLAVQLGFKGNVLGDFPGGGGYHLDMINEDVKEVLNREYIIFKGYQGEKHRGLQVLKAVELINDHPKVIIFSADDAVYNYYMSSEKLKAKNIKIFRANEHINHSQLCKMMNSSLIYIGNNLSDGMPNTLLEAICFGAFPIQSNPGGASAEIIEDGKNGLLIKDCDDVLEIKTKIEFVIDNCDLLKSAFKLNMKLREQLEYNYIREKVLKKYKSIENDIKK